MNMFLLVERMSLPFVGVLFVLAVVMFTLMELAAHQFKKSREFNSEEVARLIAHRLGLQIVPYNTKNLDAMLDRPLLCRVVEKSENRLLECGASGVVFHGKRAVMYPYPIKIPDPNNQALYNYTVNRLMSERDRATRDPAPFLSVGGGYLLFYYMIERPRIPMEEGREEFRTTPQEPDRMEDFLESLWRLSPVEIDSVMSEMADRDPAFYQKARPFVAKIKYIQSLGCPSTTLSV